MLRDTYWFYCCINWFCASLIILLLQDHYKASVISLWWKIVRWYTVLVLVLWAKCWVVILNGYLVLFYYVSAFRMRVYMWLVVYVLWNVSKLNILLYTSSWARCVGERRVYQEVQENPLTNFKKYVYFTRFRYSTAMSMADYCIFVCRGLRKALSKSKMCHWSKKFVTTANIGWILKEKVYFHSTHLYALTEKKK